MEDHIEIKKKKKIGGLYKVSPLKIIPVVFALIIFTGAVLLTFPAAQKEGFTSFSDALFTATSATCVTGLVRFDTFTHWSLFGQIVILAMIQIGGIGFMTIAVWLMSFTKHKIGLNSRFIMQSAIASPNLEGMVRITRFILLGTIIVEGTGAVLLSTVFVPEFGIKRGIYYGIFHSISAFCNAGFDLMGANKQFSSVTAYSGNYIVNLTIMSLIVIGGLGFIVWEDLIDKKFRFSKLRLHTKIVVTVTLSLIFGGALVLFLLETGTEASAGKPLDERVLNAFFQSVTARTAGFNSVDLTAMSESSVYVMIWLMMIGGSPGSTAGGIKTTTFAVLIISIISVFRRKKNEEIYGRRLEERAMRTSACVFMSYLILTTVAAVIISKIEMVPVLTALYESVSAIGTVGLSMGITPHIGMVSKFILIILMYVGRVGSMTILMAFSSERRLSASKRPLEKVQLG